MLKYKLIEKSVLFSIILFTNVFAGATAIIKNVNLNVNACSDNVSPTEELCLLCVLQHRNHESCVATARE